MKKVLINGLQLCEENTGVQYYTENLLKEISNKDNIEIHSIVSNNYKRNINGQIYLHNINIGNSRLKRIIYENIYLPKFLIENHYRLYHSTNYILPYFCSFPSILTIHDLITFEYPKLCQRESVFYFKLLLSRSIKRATKIIAVSNTIKNDILRRFDVPDAKIEVVYHGINLILKKTENIDNLKKTRQKYHLPERYILFVGNIEPKKNLERLIRAFDKLRKTTELKHKLVIVGKKGWKYNSVFKTIDELKIRNEIIFTGYVPEVDLSTIYSMADLFMFPSLYEGFGIPPLEAMACEVPVIVSNKGALPEVTGGRCLQIDPYNVQEITEVMYKLLTDTNLRRKSILQGNEWVKQFSWEKAAKETLNVYEQAIFNNI